MLRTERRCRPSGRRSGHDVQSRHANVGPSHAAVLALVLSGASSGALRGREALEPGPWSALYDEAVVALAGGDAQAAVDAVERAARRAPPNHPYLLYAKVRAYTKAGRADEAFTALGLLAEKGIAADVLVSPSFEALRDHGRWPEWQEKLQALVAPAQRSVVAFRLNEPDFFPDAMTYDRGSRRFLIGSLFKRKVVVVDEVSGRAVDYATSREAGFLGVRGLQADNQRGALYVLSAGGPEMQGYAAAEEGQSFLHRLQLSSGRQVTRTPPPPLAAGHLLDELVQAVDGTLYMTDARAGVLYRWRPGARAMEPVRHDRRGPAAEWAGMECRWPRALRLPHRGYLAGHARDARGGAGRRSCVGHARGHRWPRHLPGRPHRRTERSPRPVTRRAACGWRRTA